MKTSCLILPLFFIASCPIVSGQGQLIDQSYAPNYSDNFDFFTTRGAEGERYLFGQEFVPSLSSLDFVDLFINVNGSAVFGPLRLHVEIRGDTIDGPILGTSTALGYVSSFRGEAHLTFPAPVSLNPGDRYVIRVYANDGLGTGYIIGIGVPREGVGTPYDGGHWIYPRFGAPFTEGRDVWFREGLMVVPEPGTWALFIAAGAAFLLFRRLRRA